MLALFCTFCICLNVHFLGKTATGVSMLNLNWNNVCKFLLTVTMTDPWYELRIWKNEVVFDCILYLLITDHVHVFLFLNSLFILMFCLSFTCIFVSYMLFWYWNVLFFLIFRRLHTLLFTLLRKVLDYKVFNSTDTILCHNFELLSLNFALKFDSSIVTF
jgi:hypothetical protein